MIRGLVGIVPYHAVEVGRFYMAPAYRTGYSLYQCVQTAEPFEDGFRKKALTFTRGGNCDIWLDSLPDQGSVVAIDDVHVRVDPTSLAETPFTTTLHRGMFLVADADAIICAPTDPVRGWQAVNLMSGRTVSNSLGTNWLSFARWSLVMDDEEGDELTIASFGDEEHLAP